MIIYLIHAQAERVFACEWNPEAVKALKLNFAEKQNWSHKISFQNDAFCVFNFIFGKVQFERFDSLWIPFTGKNAFGLGMNEVNN